MDIWLAFSWFRLNIIQFLLPASDVTVEATFESAPIPNMGYPVIVSSVDGGSVEVTNISGTAITTALSGSTVRFTATPDEGIFEFTGWVAYLAGSTPYALTAAQQTANPLEIDMPMAALTLTPTYKMVGVRVGNVVWAPTNSKPNPGGTATFQSTPYVYDSAQDTNLIQWTTATGGISGNTAAGVCPPNWRLPTSAEYQALYNASAAGNISGYKGTWSTINGVNGLTLTTASGKLFFAATGGRDASGTLYHSHTFGGYWSSIQIGAPDAYGLRFDSVAVLPSTFSTINTYYFSIRCVRSL